MFRNRENQELFSQDFNALAILLRRLGIIRIDYLRITLVLSNLSEKFVCKLFANRLKTKKARLREPFYLIDNQCPGSDLKRYDRCGSQDLRNTFKLIKIHQRFHCLLFCF